MVLIRLEEGLLYVSAKLAFLSPKFGFEDFLVEESFLISFLLVLLFLLCVFSTFSSIFPLNLFNCLSKSLFDLFISFIISKTVVVLFIGLLFSSFNLIFLSFFLFNLFLLLVFFAILIFNLFLDIL